MADSEQLYRDDVLTKQEKEMDENLKLANENLRLRSTQMIAEQLIEASNAPNGEIVIMRNLEKFSECCMEGAKRAAQFVEDVSTIQGLIEEIDDKQLSKLVEERKRKGEDVPELPNKNDDVEICRKAIAMSKKSSKITRETMKVCRDVSLEIGDMKSFFLTINMATKRYKEGRYVECKEKLAKLRTQKFPCAEHIVKSLLELQPKWEKLQDDMAELSGSFHDMMNKYNNAKELFDKKNERCIIN